MEKSEHELRGERNQIQFEREILEDPDSTPAEKAHAANNIALRVTKLDKDQ